MLNIESLSNSRAVNLFMLGVGALLPSVLWMFLFKSSMFNSLEPFKLVLLTSSINVPIFLFNILMLMILEGDNAPKTLKDQIAGFTAFIAASAFITSAVFYLPCLIKLFYDLPVKWSIGIIASIEAVFFIITMWDLWLQKKARKKTNQD